MARIQGLRYPPTRGFPMGDGLDLSQIWGNVTSAIPGAIQSAEQSALSTVTGAAVTAPTVQAAAKQAAVTTSTNKIAAFLQANMLYVGIGSAIIIYLAFFRRR